MTAKAVKRLNMAITMKYYEQLEQIQKDLSEALGFELSITDVIHVLIAEQTRRRTLKQ